MDQELDAAKPCLVLINLDTPPVPEDHFYEQKQELFRLNIHTGLELARHANTTGRYTARIICPSSGPLFTLAAQDGIAAIPCDGKLLQLWRIWNWQKKISKMQLAVIGVSGLQPGFKLLKMRKKTGQTLTSVFFEIPENIKTKDIARLTTCICGSPFIREKLQAMAQGAKSAGETVFLEIAPGMDVNRYPVKQPDRGRRFVFAMNESLMPESGALQVVRAMSALWHHPDLPEWEIRMFGNGPGFEEIMAEAEKLGVLPRLSILNCQDPAEITAHADAWLAPGCNPRELPSTFWGGMAAGLPVIASDTPLHIQRLPDPACAILTPSENPQELAGAMLALMLNRPHERRNPSINFRQWFSYMGAAQRLLPLLVNPE